jgi:hypothetical protein
MSRYKPPVRLVEIFGFLEWFLVRAFLTVVLALELWECLRYIIQHMR